MTRVIIALALLASAASAETLHDGRVYTITADRIIMRERMRCVYGRWRLETLSNGTTALVRQKRCEKVSSSAKPN